MMPRGFTLMESVIASAVLALLVVAGLNASGSLGVARRAIGDRAVAMSIAQATLAEVCEKRYEDADEPGGPLGLEKDEPLTRSTFDDVDDYTGLQESPPLDAGGLALTTEQGWEQTVRVEWVQFQGGALVAVGADEGVKRVMVTVRLRGRVVAEATAVRSRGWDDAKP